MQSIKKIVRSVFEILTMSIFRPSKLTIKAYYAEKALNNSLWPVGVGVRRFKQRKGSVRKNDTRKTGQQKNIQNQNNQHPGSYKITEGTWYHPNFTDENRFQALYGQDDDFV